MVLGQRIRRGRIAKGVSIRDLSERANVSKTSIVRLEGGLSCHATTVAKICAGIGLHLDRFLDPSEAEIVSVHRRDEDQWYDLVKFADGPVAGAEDEATRRKLSQSGLAPVLLYKNGLANGQIWPALMELYAETPMRSHPGEEWIYVLEGSVQVNVGDQNYTLSRGECMNFWSSEEHSYAPAEGAALPVRILSVTVGGGA